MYNKTGYKFTLLKVQNENKGRLDQINAELIRSNTNP